LNSNYPIRAAWANLDFNALVTAQAGLVENWWEPGLGPSRGFRIALSTGRAARVEWREHQSQYVEICLEYHLAFYEADLIAVAEVLGVHTSVLNKESGLLAWGE